MQKMTLRLLLTLLCGWGILYAQSPERSYEVRFKSGTVIFPENANSAIENHTLTLGEGFDGQYYRYLQFEEIPRQSQQEAIKQSGLQLLEYIPNNTYLAAIPTNYDLGQLIPYGIRSIMPVDPFTKIDPLLSEAPYPDWALNGDRIKLTIMHQPSLAETSVRNALLQEGFSILSSSTNYPIITLMVPTERIQEVAAMPFVTYVEPIEAPAVPDDFNGRGIQRANAIDTDFPSNRQYDGSGINIMVRDDGAIGPHIDFKGRMNSASSGASTGTHGDGVAGIFVGAGNLDPTVKGMAPGAFLYVLSYQANFLDNTLPLHQTDSVMITNSSYSNGCNAGYTGITQTVDQQIFDNKNLMHCFSAGNSNGGCSSYGAGNQWGNITGGHKIGKNVIATANLDAVGNLQTSSSRGPASDGRIKPDISAHGAGQRSTNPNNGYQSFGGTSAAAPSMAGVLTQLYHAYRELNNNDYPNSGLMKAILMNSANELGNIGPDYKYGWGLVNGRRALDILEKDYFLSDTLTQGNTNMHTISVPAGTQQVRIMTYWMDPQGSPASALALVNNLNMTVTDPVGTVHNPWVLDETPNAVTLDLPATTGVDNLNNVEQVLLNSPAAGSYTVTVNGFAVPQGPQEYFVVYVFVPDEIVVTYPMGGEGFVPGETENIHWDAHGITGNFTVEYTTNNGTTWNTISSSVGGSQRLLSWTVPSSVTGQARVRVTRGSLSDESDVNFSIAAVPQNIQVTQVCPAYTQLTWNAVSGATGYDIFMLGAQYMDSVGSSATTTFDIPNVDPFADHWFSVRAKGVNNMRGRRAIAINYTSTGLLNCIISDDVALQLLSPSNGVSYDCHPDSIDVTVRLQNGGVNAQSNFPVSYQFNGGTVVTETYTASIVPGGSATHTFANPVVMSALGTYTLNSWSGLLTDGFPQNDTANAVIDRVAGTTITAPFTENFETQGLCGTANNCGVEICSLTGGWLNIDNLAGDDIDWRVDEDGTNSGGTGPTIDHNPGTSSGNYLYLEASGGCEGQTAELISPCINLGPASGPQLSFWYHMNGVDMGELHLDIFYNGGWIEDVIPPLVGSQGNLWLEQLVNLSPYSGGVVNLRFRGITGNGFESDIAIDDISIAGALAQPVTNFSANIFSTCIGNSITFTDQTAGIPDTWAWNFSPNTVSYVAGTNSASQNPEVVFNANGLYEVRLAASNSIGNDTLTIVNYIEINAGAPLDVIEEFQSGTFPPANWELDNPDGGDTWETASVIGSNGNASVTAFVDNYSYDAAGAEDVLGTFAMDLTSATLPRLSFDVSYARYSSTLFDGLRVELSTDCGQTFTNIVYDKSGTVLATAPDQTSVFSPNSSQWRRDTVLLSPYIGSSVVIRFVNVNGYGNSLYLDNINITDVTIPLPNAGMSLNISSLCPGDPITFSDASTGDSISAYSWNFGNGAVPATANTAGPHAVSYTTPGPKNITLTVTNAAGNNSAVQAITINPLPVAGFTVANPVGFDFTFTNTSTDGLVYLWDFGDGTTANMSDPMHTYTSNGLYTVQLVAINSCGNDTITLDVEVGTVPADAQFTISSTTICENEIITFTDATTGDSIQSYSWDFGSGAMPATANTSGPHLVAFATPGQQTVRLIVSNPGGSDTTTSVLTIDPLPTAAFTYTDQGAQSFQFNNNSTDVVSYLWDFGNDSTSTLESPSTTYLTNDSYPVTLIVTNECGSDTSEQLISILNVSLLEELAGVAISLFPNPNSGIFDIRLEGNSANPFEIDIRDMRGRVLEHFQIDRIQGSFDQKVDVSYLAEGVYTVQISSGGEIGTIRFTKK